jgi:hypothetical protein
MQRPSGEQREDRRSLGDLMRIVSCLVAARYASGRDDRAGGFSSAREAVRLESASPSRPCPPARRRSAGDPQAMPTGRDRCRKAIDA